MKHLGLFSEKLSRWHVFQQLIFTKWELSYIVKDDVSLSKYNFQLGEEKYKLQHWNNQHINSSHIFAMLIWMILWMRAFKGGLLLPWFRLPNEQLGMMTFLVKASLERVLLHGDKLKAQNKAIQDCQCLTGLKLKRWY